MSIEASIPCPDCKMPIPFDTKKMLMGTAFSCPNCHAVIELSKESNNEVNSTLEKFERLRRDLSK
ncbi:MAG: hypothetical protein R2793_02165 [Flavobacteriaceae bacterium]